MSSPITKVPMTLDGEKKLREELQHLKTNERPRIIQAISEARAHGDLKENAEYHAAKEQQGFTEFRIREIEGKLSSAQVIDISQMENTGKVIFGATVSLLDVDTDDEATYQIVGEDEADIKEAKISVSSPMARAMIGKMEGDEITVNTPKGEKIYEVAKVSYI